ncbi:MAG: LptF/LptG family permease [Sphingobacteriaceae bacterium]|nr:LptF/LptG family permease [Sphingobacteriaceae bacterium]
MLTILDKYILKKFFKTFIVSITLILLIFIVFDIKEKIPTYTQGNIPISEIITNYYLMFIPYYTNLFSPLFTFIAVIFFTAKMAQQTEFVAILSAGASFGRIMRPYLIGSGLIALVSITANHFFLPKFTKVKIAFEDKWINNNYVNDENNIHKKIGPNQILYMRDYDNRINTATKISIEKIVNNKQTDFLEAESMVWDSLNKEWTLLIVTERKLILQDRLDTLKNQKPLYSQTVKNYPSKKLKIEFTPADMWRYESKVEVMPYFELKEYIARETLRGSDMIPFFEVENYRRTSFPIATIILTVMGVSISSRKIRGGVGLQMALGLLLSCIYIMLMYVFTTLATTSVAPPFIAVWTPNFIFTFVALYFYSKAQR